MNAAPIRTALILTALAGGVAWLAWPDEPHLDAGPGIDGQATFDEVRRLIESGQPPAGAEDRYPLVPRNAAGETNGALGIGLAHAQGDAPAIGAPAPKPTGDSAADIDWLELMPPEDIKKLQEIPPVDHSGFISAEQFMSFNTVKELDGLIAANGETPKAELYRAMRASILFDTQDRAAALAELAAVLAAAEPSDQTRNIKAVYATLLNRDGQADKADTVIAEILAEDPAHQEALFLRAARNINADRATEAIIDLRAALNQAPNDARLLSALARAYLRDGNTDLATETMARAVQAAPNQPALARDYARLLEDLGRREVARAVIYDAWQNNSGDPGLIEMLSSVALADDDWRLAAEILNVLRGAPTDAGLAAADQFESAVLLDQGKFDEGLAIIDRRLAAQGENVAGKAAWTLLRVDGLIRAGRRDEALAELATAAAAMPEEPSLRHRQAELAQEDDKPEEAIAIYRGLIETDPADDRAVRILYGLLVAAGQTDEAVKVLQAGMAARPDSVDLRWVEASRLQDAGDIAGAVAIYEALYAQDSGNPIIANNLASLLPVLSDDPATAERAARIARRLRASEVPAFQDTYGWTLHLTGKSAEALPVLEAAAAGLPEDGSVQYHLGSVLAALGRKDEARAALERAIALAPSPQAPHLARAEAALAALDAPVP